MSRLTDTHYMVLVGCNNDAGMFTGKAFGVEIYAPNDHTESLFTASTLLDDELTAFWETKRGIAFSCLWMDAAQIMHRKRLHYPAIHGAQHVGNIFWNAYFVTQDTAMQMALDLELCSEFHTEGEWSDNAQGDIAARVKAIRDAKQQPALPGLNRLPVRSMAGGTE